MEAARRAGATLVLFPVKLGGQQSTIDEDLEVIVDVFDFEQQVVSSYVVMIARLYHQQL